jgi:hypothetical protein
MMMTIINTFSPALKFFVLPQPFLNFRVRPACLLYAGQAKGAASRSKQQPQRTGSSSSATSSISRAG